MPGSGPLPKPAAQRRRRNTAPGEQSLRPGDAIPAPKLPFRVAAATASWWASIWASPMAPMWLPSDTHGLFMLADLMDSYWTASDPAVKAKLSTEIRLQSQRFGLSPIDRVRLRWNVVEPPKATANKPTARRVAKSDPRLKVV